MQHIPVKSLLLWVARLDRPLSFLCHAVMSVPPQARKLEGNTVFKGTMPVSLFMGVENYVGMLKLPWACLALRRINPSK